jgi:zinc/manganese transport system substrate-binding protein
VVWHGVCKAGNRNCHQPFPCHPVGSLKGYEVKKIYLSLVILLLATSPAFASLRIVATLPWIGSLAKEIGKDKVSVTTLVKPSQDPHTVEAKPSMMMAGRRADMIMYNGLDLEIGYLPLILESSKNPAIMPGKPGNFDCSRFVVVIEKHTHANRSMGDIHHLGNPHYHYSPANILKIAEGMSAALAERDPANAAFYKANQKSFAARVADRKNSWKALNLTGKRFIAHHKMFEYLAMDFDLRIGGYIEPKPGIPPSAGYLDGLIARMRVVRPDAILITNYSGRKEAEAVSRASGVKIVSLPADVGAESGTGDWITFMDTVLNRLK